ncbi:MAG: GDSL-type esterase/lipase family protein [Thermoflexales bacterium]
MLRIWVGLFLVGMGLALGACGVPATAPSPTPVVATRAPTEAPVPLAPETGTPTRMPPPTGQPPTELPPPPTAMAPLPTAALSLPVAPVSPTPIATPTTAPATQPTRASAAALPPALPTLTAVRVAALAPGATAQAAIRIDGAFARTSPGLTAPRAFPVFEGNLLSAVGRTTDGNWVAVASPDGTAGWLLLTYAAIEAGFAGLPVTQSPGAGLVTPASFPAYLSLPLSARQRYRAALGAGRDGRVFTVAGACNSEAYAYVRRVATALYDTSGLTALHGAVKRFAPSFSRVSMAARGGYTVSSLFDASWVEPGICPLGEGPLACELRQTNASIIIIELGTGDQFGWKDFEPHYRAIVDYALGVGALPILVTKADDLDHQQGGSPAGFINDVVRRIASEKQLPLIDFHAATRGLPNFGLLDEGNFDFHLSPAGSDLHLQATLQMLNALIQ